MIGIMIVLGIAVINGILGYKFKYSFNWFVCGFGSGIVLYMILDKI